MQEKIIILDFGSQTTQLIGRRVRELWNQERELAAYYHELKFYLVQFFLSTSSLV